MTILVAFLLGAPAAHSFPAPDCSVPGFREQGEARSYDPETLFDYLNGNSEGYFAYGFALMTGVTCVNAAGDQLVVDVSEMGDADRAWGFFVANRDLRSPTERIGSGGQVLPRRATFAKDRYYAEIAASPDKDHREALRAFVSALEARIRGDDRGPDAVAWFPREGLEPDSIRMVPESVLGLRVLKSGFVGQYAAGRAFVVPQASAEVATATMGALRARYARRRAPPWRDRAGRRGRGPLRCRHVDRVPPQAVRDVPGGRGERIAAECRRDRPALLGVTVLQVDSEEDLCWSGHGLPEETRLVAGGAAFRTDPDLAGRCGVDFVAGNVAAFIGYLLQMARKMKQVKLVNGAPI